jgi:hypothetical protein
MILYRIEQRISSIYRGDGSLEDTATDSRRVRIKAELLSFTITAAEGGFKFE